MCSASTLRRARRAGWYLALSLLVAAPLWSARYPPFSDFTEHAAVSAALAHFNDPAWRVRELFTFAPWATPYWLYDLVVALVARATGDAVVAHKLVLTLSCAALPWSTAGFLRALGRHPGLAVLACSLFWSRALQYGLLPFVASIPVLFWALGLYVRVLRQPPTATVRARAARVVGALLVSCVLPFLHIATFAVFWVTAAGYGLLWRRRPVPGRWSRAMRVDRVLPLASGLVVIAYAAVAWRDGLDHELRFRGFGRTLASIPRWSFDVWHRREEAIFAAIYWAGCLGVFWSGRSRQVRLLLVRAWPLFAAILVLVVLPFQLGAVIALNVRLAPIVGIMVLPLLRLRKSWWARASAIAGVVGTVGQAWVAHCATVDAQASLGDFQRIIAAVPPGSRIFYLPLETRASGFFPWVRMAAAIRAEKGGISQFSFTQLPHWPLQNRVAPPKAPPASLAAADMKCWFDAATDGAFYDVLLVRGAYDPFRGTSDTVRHPMADQFELTVVAPPFYLWERRRPPGALPLRALPQPNLLPAPCRAWGTTE
ncbi:MAG: hypothetical protein HOO96_29535 [Polyangiaceae bacterium]|nr:hypothetical protein [Polyangiaceae bacterium]